MGRQTKNKEQRINIQEDRGKVPKGISVAHAVGYTVDIF